MAWCTGLSGPTGTESWAGLPVIPTKHLLYARLHWLSEGMGTKRPERPQQILLGLLPRPSPSPPTWEGKHPRKRGTSLSSDAER